MNLQEVSQKANDIRKDIVSMIAEAGSGHPGGSLSCADIMAVLYFGNVLQYDPHNPEDDQRDYFILAKGHAAPALYATLAEAGYFPKSELLTLRKLGTRLQGHPDSTLLEGVEVSTGSLGQGLSIAAGVAAGFNLKKSKQKVFTLLGDGECQEGQVWEAANFAAHQNLGNLIAIVDENGLQIDGPCEEVCGSGGLDAKFKAFGWAVHRVNGHNIEELHTALIQAKNADAHKPQVLIAQTVKGKGVSFMENKAGWHGKAPSKEELDQALKELAATEVVNG